MDAGASRLMTSGTIGSGCGAADARSARRPSPCCPSGRRRLATTATTAASRRGLGRDNPLLGRMGNPSGTPPLRAAFPVVGAPAEESCRLHHGQAPVTVDDLSKLA